MSKLVKATAKALSWFGAYQPETYGREDAERDFFRARPYQFADAPTADLREVESALAELVSRLSVRAGRTDRMSPSNGQVVPDAFQRAVDLLDEYLELCGLDPLVLARLDKVSILRLLGDAFATMKLERAGLEVSRHQAFSDKEWAIIDDANARIESLGTKFSQSLTAAQSKARHEKRKLRQREPERKEALREHEKGGYEVPRRMMPLWLYYPLLTFVALLEFPLNFLAFSSLSVPKVGVLLLAIVPCAAVLILSHLGGVALRQLPARGRDGRRAYLWILLGVFIAAIITLGALAVLRQQYVHGPGAAGPSQWLIGIALLMLNGVFLAMGLAASYFSHDPDRAVEVNLARRREAERNSKRLRRAYNGAVARFDARAGALRERFGAIRSHAIARMNEYRWSNVRHRADDEWPREAWALAPSERCFKVCELPERDLPPTEIDMPSFSVTQARLAESKEGRP